MQGGAKPSGVTSLDFGSNQNTSGRLFLALHKLGPRSGSDQGHPAGGTVRQLNMPGAQERLTSNGICGSGVRILLGPLVVL